MTSRRRYDEAYVWIWLPGSTEPVVAGRLDRDEEGRLTFTYGRSYLARGDAIPLYAPELPLQRGIQEPAGGLAMPSCIRDASPDAWGRRVIINRSVGIRATEGQLIDLDELTYLMESGSDRIGALDFQASPTRYEPRLAANVPLDELVAAAARVEQGLPLSPELDNALNHGTSIGGARPKALIDDGDRKHIAKFSASNDTYSVVKAEFVAMRLAAHAGLDVAPVRLERAAHKDVLLIERFDRLRAKAGWQRRALVSALTIHALDEMMAAYTSYETLAEEVSRRFTDARATIEELYRRLVFNILVGNTDDHARNHAAFWDGRMLTLTPAYDICPQARTGGEASQAMLIVGNDRSSRISTCLRAATAYGIRPAAAAEVVERQILAIDAHWEEVCAEANLTPVDRALFWGRQFLNPYATDDLDGNHAALRILAEDVRRRHLAAAA